MNKSNPKIDALNKVLNERLETVKDMQSKNVKFQRQQGTKEDIYRLKREISELKNKKHELEITSIKEMWGIELGDLERHLYPNNKRKRD